MEEAQTAMELQPEASGQPTAEAPADAAPSVEEMLYCFDLPSPSMVLGFTGMVGMTPLWWFRPYPVEGTHLTIVALAMEWHGIPKEWDTSCFKQLCHSLFSDQHDYLFEQAVDHLCDVIFRDEDRWTVFAGQPPGQTKPSKS